MKGMILSTGFLLFLAFAAAAVYAQPVVPLDAALAGTAVEMPLNRVTSNAIATDNPAAGGPEYVPVRYCGREWIRGHYNRHGEWVRPHWRYGRWIEGHYDRRGYWVRGHCA